MKIDLGWLQAVTKEVHDASRHPFPLNVLVFLQFFAEELGIDPLGEEVKEWAGLLHKNFVRTVGTLAKQKQEALERWGIPGAIAMTLAEQAALCPK